jgi:hypothetical protein
MATKKKILKGIEFFNLWIKWCKTFDKNLKEEMKNYEKMD